MNTFIKLLIMSFFSVAAFDLLSAQYNNSAALETITPDARAAGMAGIGSATSPDVFSQHWNPAKYALSTGQAGIGVSYVPWMLMATSEDLYYVSGFYKTGKQAISASVRYFSVDKMNLLDDRGATYAGVSPSQYSFDLGYSRTFGNYFSLGAAIRYINLFSVVANNDATSYIDNRISAIAGDIGIYFQQKANASDEFALGLSFKNIGTKVDMGSGNLYLPMCMNLGGRYSWGIDANNLLTFVVDINKPLIPEDQTEGVFKGFFNSFGNTIKEWGLSGGAEYAYLHRYFVRTGYHFGGKDARYGTGSYFSAGLGTALNHFTLDVSYMISTSANAAMSNTFAVSLQYIFGGAKTNVKTE